jgi:hypothetical protein
MMLLNTINAGTSSKMVPRDLLASSAITKVIDLKYNGDKLKEGDDVLFINRNYKMKRVYILTIIGELKSARPFFKVFDVVVTMKELNIPAYCVYFGIIGKICLRKDVEYKLFDEIIDDDDEKLPDTFEGKDAAPEPGYTRVQR